VFSHAVPFDENVDAQIFFSRALPRAIAAALVGGTLAAAGVVFQGLLRNPLATPYTLGVDAGASLGAMIANRVPAPRCPSAASRPASLAGAAWWPSASCTRWPTRGIAGLSTTVLLLSGVTLNRVLPPR
jgi:iron complex transport system permease protein